MAKHYPDGEYWVNITGQTLTNSKKGDPMIVIDFEPQNIGNPEVPVTDSAHWEGLPVEMYARKLYMMVTENAVEYTIKKLKQLGLELKSWADIEEGGLIGKTAVLICKEGTPFNNQPSESWDLPYEGGEAAEPLDDTATAKLDAMFGKYLTT